MAILKEESAIRYFLSSIKQLARLAKFKSEWRCANRHNKTNAANIFPQDKVHVGKGTYGDLTVYAFGGSREGLEIGHYCSIAGNVTFILGGEHAMNRVSTYPFARHVFALSDDPDKATKGKIVIEDDVWICHGVTILSGVNIGQGAVIGAGSIVTKDVPPYAVYVGNAIKRYRFSDDVIKLLMKIDYSMMDEVALQRFRECCNKVVDDRNAADIVHLIRGEEW